MRAIGDVTFLYWTVLGARGRVVVKALRYKPAGSGLDLSTLSNHAEQLYCVSFVVIVVSFVRGVSIGCGY